MKLEFLHDIEEREEFIDEASEQLIRLYDFDAAEATSFCEAIQTTIITNKQTLDLALLSFIVPVNCLLTLEITDTDEGISYKGKETFVCQLTLESYKQILKQCQPFCEGKSRGFQWLYELDTPIDFLFSPRGTW
jgi:hypothetical protein